MIVELTQQEYQIIANMVRQVNIPAQLSRLMVSLQDKFPLLTENNGEASKEQESSSRLTIPAK